MSKAQLALSSFLARQSAHALGLTKLEPLRLLCRKLWAKPKDLGWILFVCKTGSKTFVIKCNRYAKGLEISHFCPVTMRSFIGCLWIKLCFREGQTCGFVHRVSLGFVRLCYRWKSSKVLEERPAFRGHSLGLRGNVCPKTGSWAKPIAMRGWGA